MVSSVALAVMLLIAASTLPSISSSYIPVKKCYTPDHPKYGSIKVVGYKAYYSCDKGYSLYGGRYITCKHGKWIGKVPICKPLLCPKVRAPKYGSVDVKRYDHSYRAVFSCNYGYHLYGDEYITCDYGKWKGRIPICKPIICPKVRDIKYGYVKLRGYGHGSKAVYYCNHGYKLYGDGYLTCNYGKWKGTPPVCRPTQCKALKAPQYGSVAVKGYGHGSKAVYSCNYGYRLYGKGYIKCIYGAWKGRAPVCKPIHCPYIKAPKYGFVKVKGYYHGSKATYFCRKGYKLYGDDYNTCDYGKWVGKIPVCKPITCPKLYAPKYGSIKVTGYGYGSKAIYSCDDGYYIYGRSYRQCSYGKWLGKIPVCKAYKCLDPPPPKYGKVVVGGYRATYSCNHGYSLYGDDYNVCQYGKWIRKIPICKPINCPEVYAPEYGSVDVKGYSHSSRAEYSCNHGYYLYGDRYITCDYGIWKGKTPICKPSLCPKLKAPEYGSVDVKGYGHSSRAVYSCNHGYKLYGDGYITCDYGVWKGKIPICKPIICPKVTAPEYGSVDVKGYSHSSRAVYSCNYGYTLYGDGYITCDYGIWKGKIPICKPILCPKLKAPDYGSVDVKGYGHSFRAVYSCNHGYKLYGDGYITCDYGVWKGKIPICKPILCPKVAVPDYGSVDVKGYGHGSRAVYSCNHGYKQYGDGYITCDYGIWKGKIPLCKPIHCSTVKAPKYGSVDVKGYGHNSRAVYTCDYGYTLYGDGYITCDYGIWKGKIPICKRIVRKNCPYPQPPHYGSVKVTGWNIKPQAWYLCSQGYYLYGQESRLCENGRWLGEAPVCKKVHH